MVSVVAHSLVFRMQLKRLSRPSRRPFERIVIGLVVAEIVRKLTTHNRLLQESGHALVPVLAVLLDLRRGGAEKEGKGEECG
jgi:hypothetical protein